MSKNSSLGRNPFKGSVTPWFWPHGIKIVYYVNIVIKSWRGAQGQGPMIDLVFCVSAIKIDADVYSASQEQYILKISCKYEI